MKTCSLEVVGIVQGVGFRPFVYKIAKKNNLFGHVYNDLSGVKIFLQGSDESIEKFMLDLRVLTPPAAVIKEVKISWSDESDFSDFEIIQSDISVSKMKSVFVPQDLKICDDCLREMQDPLDRRYLYPFINCTNCGPRFSIIRDIPYDRMQTTMSEFILCQDCETEYHNPEDRRYHAEPIACSSCGPELMFTDSFGQTVGLKQEALKQAVEKILSGHIVAIKGIGGFQLLTLAKNEQALSLLRERKKRTSKPFAIMILSQEDVYNYVFASAAELNEVFSPRGPIVLLKDKKKLPALLNPGLSKLGIMAPTSGLHYLLLKHVGAPLVVTSGNLSEEPLCIENQDALSRLGGEAGTRIADYFLFHNRKIERAIDDSVVEFCDQKRLIIRHARGFAPTVTSAGLTDEVTFSRNKSSQKSDSSWKEIRNMVSNQKMPQILAFGGHLKSHFSFLKNNQLITSQYLGDLDSEMSFEFYKTELKKFIQFYQLNPEYLVIDQHPGYLSRQIISEVQNSVPDKNIIEVQHHEAHAWSSIFEFGMQNSDCFVAVWDGAGFSVDKIFQGGEFYCYLGGQKILTHQNHFSFFYLVGLEKAFKENWRCLVSFLNFFCEKKEITQILKSLRINVSDELATNYALALEKESLRLKTTSVGRLFDAVSCLLGFSLQNSYEGEAAMKLQSAAECLLDQRSVLEQSICLDQKGLSDRMCLPDLIDIHLQNILVLKNNSLAMTNNSSCVDILFWLKPLVENLSRSDFFQSIEQDCLFKRQMAFEFHVLLAQLLIEEVLKYGQTKLLVSGGVFQNQLLLQIIQQLSVKNNIEFFFPQMISTNDGGLGIGQINYFIHSQNNI